MDGIQQQSDAAGVEDSHTHSADEKCRTGIVAEQQQTVSLIRGKLPLLHQIRNAAGT